MAEVPLSDVLRRWQGLGYPRRARNLHTAAAVLVHRHRGIVPDRRDELLALPGVGPYTARAVQAFAFGATVGVLDTNVGRVLARWSGSRLRPADAQALADALVPRGEGWAWNQSLLDFAADVCTKRTPSCVQCRVRAGCGWAGAGADPAVGSAAVSRPQAPFQGSLRQARGVLLSRLADGPCPVGEAWAPAAESLAEDGLIARRGGDWVLAD
jgi:A/G-specific adenine glycosylase